MSDFPEFDHAYQTILIKDPNDRFDQLAAQAHFNVYHSDIWRGTARRFAELIVLECANIAANPAPGAYTSFGDEIKKHFGINEGS